MNYPNAGVAVFVKKGNSILLGSRIQAVGFGDGEWCLPGGKLDWFEELEDGCRRETLEETGISVDNLSFVGFSNDKFPIVNKHYVTLYYAARVPPDTVARVMEPNKSREWRWFPLDNLPPNIFCSWQPLVSKVRELN